MLLDDYAKARRKAKAAEDTSDLQSEIDQAGALKKRRISRPPRFNNDDESSSDCTLSVLPSPPRQRTNTKIVTAINEDVGSPSLLANIGGERRRQQHHEAINSHYSHSDNEESLDMAEQSIVRNQEAGHSKEGLETLITTIYEEHRTTRASLQSSPHRCTSRGKGFKRRSASIKRSGEQDSRWRRP
ncbi:uncharacterized protein LOC143218427 [Lasioglossum baleicum]|uniref:uncharacterized protein LOC143218427 n=1 Tax=Lasioglossum baleicum TaxID=434251 RepID=UPI003FCD5661